MTDRAAPDCHLRLEWVYGYKGHQCHNNLLYCGNKVVYFVAGVCIVYDPEQHKQSFYLGHTDDILCLSMHPDEKLLASGQIGKDPFICVWDCGKCETKSLLQNGHQRGISAVCFSHDGTYLASIGMDDHNTLCIWDWQKGRVIAQSRTHGERVVDVKFSPSASSQLVTCGLKHIKFWSLCGNTLTSKSGILGKFGPTQSFHSLHFDASNNAIAGAANGALYIFEKNKASRAQLVHKGPLLCVSGCDSGYVTGGKDGLVHLLDAEFNITHTYNLPATEQGYKGLCVKSVFWKGTKILVGTENSEIFELSTKFKDKVTLLVQGHSEGELWALATHPTKASMFATSSDDCTLQQWNLTEHGVVGKKNLCEKARSLAYSPDAELLAIGFTDGSFSVVKSKDLSEVHQAQIRKEVIHELKFSPDGAYLAVGSNDNYVDIFAVAQSWKKVGQCSGSSSFITHLDWSQDGKYLQTNSGAAERLVYKMPSGKRLTSKDEIDQIVWQTWTAVLGQEVNGIWAKYGDTNDVNALDVNFQQGVCVTGDDFGLVKLFNFPTFKKGAKFKKYVGHSAHVTNVRFTCDFKRVITVGGADHAIFQWKFVAGSEETAGQSPAENFELVGGDPVWSDSEASDSEMSNVGELDSDIEHEGELTYDRHFSKEMLSEFYKKENLVVSEEKDPSGCHVKPKVAPTTGLNLEFVFGYRGYDCRNNLFFLSTGEIVYHVAALGVVYDRKKHTQMFYSGHSDDILCLAVHPNKDLAATGQVGKVASVHVWDCVTLKCVSLLRGQMSRGVCSVDFSTHDGGKRLACVSLDDHHTVHIWDWKKGEKLASVRGHKDKILSIKYNPFNSHKLVIVGMKHIKFLTQAGGGLTVKRGTFGSVAKLVTMCCVTYGKGEDVCFSGAETGLVYAWRDNVLQRVIQAHNEGPCFCVSAVTNFEGFITGGKDGRICLWDEAFEKCLKSYCVEKSETCNISTTSSSNTSASLRSVRIGHGVIVAGTRNGEIVEVDKAGQVSVLIQGHAEGELWGLAVNEESDFIATASDDKTLKLWSLKEKKMLKSYPLSQAARCVDFSPNGKFIAVGFKNGSFAVFEVKSLDAGADEEWLEKLVELHHRKEEISDIKFSPVSAKYLAVASHDNFVDIYNVLSHKRVGVCKGASSYITHIDWNAEETLLMVNSGAKELLFFEAPRGKRVALRSDVIDSTLWFSFTCVIGSNVEGIWRPRCDVTDVNACSRSRDGTLLATGDDFGFVKLFTFPVKGKFAKFKQYPGHSAHVTNVRWTPDNRKLISTGGADTAICIWNNKNSADLSMREFSEANEGKAPSLDVDNQSGDSDVSFGESDEEGYDSDVTREINIDYEAKIYPSDLSLLREKQKTGAKETREIESPRSVSRNVSPGVPKVAGNKSKVSKDNISGLELEHIIGYRGFDTRDNVHFVNDNNDIVYHAAAVCIVENIATGVQKFYREHTDDVLCVSVCQSPKFKNVCASGQVGQDPAVFIWDASNMQTLSILNNGHSRGVCYLDFSSSGRFLCTVGLDEQHTIILWRWQEPFAVSQQPTGYNRLFCVKFRPDSDSRLVSAGQSHLGFWDVAGSSLIQKKPHVPSGMSYKKQTMLSIAFGPDEVTFSGSVKGDIFVWRKNVLLRVVSKAHRGPVFSLFTTLQDGLIVSSGKDRNVKESPSAVKLWDSEMRRCKAFYVEHAPKQTVIKSVSRSGNMILVGSRDSDIYKIEEKRNTCRQLVLGHAEGELCGLAVSPSDCNIFASSSNDNTLRLWNFKNLKENSSIVKLDTGSRCVAFSPDGELLAVGFNNGSFRIYNCFTLQIQAQKRDRGAVIHVIAFSPDGKRLAVGAEDASLDIYDVTSSQSLSRVTSCKGIQSKVYIADFSHDSSFIKVATGDYQSLVFDTSSGSQIDDVVLLENITWHSWTSVLGKEVEGIWPKLETTNSILGDKEFINTAHVNPSGVNRIATGDDCGLVKLFPFPCSTDGRRSEGTEGEGEEGTMQYPGHSAHVTAVKFTHDDSRLISAGGEDCCLFVWRCV